MRLKTTILTTCLLLCTFCSVSIADDVQKPNIIVVAADDMGFSDLGCYGGEIRTPTIDRLAKEGVRFSQFYNCASCGPSRASLMTGCQPWDVGQTPGANIFANLTKNCVTVMELLKANGYETCAVGRLDMITADNWHDAADIARCADRFLGSASDGAGNYFKEAKGSPWFRDGKRWARPEGAYSTDLISDYVVDFIDGTAKSDKPFFIYFSHYAPHWPLQAKEEGVASYMEIYRKQDRLSLMGARLQRMVDLGLVPKDTTLPPSMLRSKEDIASREWPIERMAINAAMVESIDCSLAKTVAALEKAGKLDNTLILILSDNGASSQLSFNRPVPAGVRPGSAETFLNHGSALAALNNTPFRGHKKEFYEGGIASPLIAWWPDGLKNKGRISNRLTHIADIMPTCLELAGVSYPGSFQGRQVIPLAGKSFVATLRDEEGDHAVPRVLAFADALRDGDWKLVRPKGAKSELYRLGIDRNETKNVADDFPEQVRKMEQQHDTVGPQLSPKKRSIKGT